MRVQRGELESTDGLSLLHFFRGKSIFVTGATGFLAKVFIEKLLRVQPQVQKIFCLIRAKNAEAASARLMTEVFDTVLFEALQAQHGRHYKDFISEKAVAVAGDMTLLNLGIDNLTSKQLVERIDVIVNCSASTVFDDRYDSILDLNTLGPQRLMEFAKLCNHLHIFLHVSTAYANGRRQGAIMEKPFKFGDCIAKELSKDCKCPDLDIEKERQLVKQVIESFEEKKNNERSDESPDKKVDDLTQRLTLMGVERANLFGWQDTYTFTKAMGEMMIDKLRGDLPVVIIRPTIIESTFSDPFPGWLQGNRMIDPIIVSYGKGRLTSFLARQDLVLDVVPVDMVVNAMMAAMAKHAKKAGLEVYHVSSSVINPLVYTKIATLAYESFKKQPCIDKSGKEVMIGKPHFLKSMGSFRRYMLFTYEIPLRVMGIVYRLKGEKASKNYNFMLERLKRAHYLASLYEHYLFFQGRFDSSNTERLYQELSQEEQELFCFDLKLIDWESYFRDIHIPGLRKHIMKEVMV